VSEHVPSSTHFDSLPLMAIYSSFLFQFLILFYLTLYINGTINFTRLYCSSIAVAVSALDAYSYFFCLFGYTTIGYNYVYPMLDTYTCASIEKPPTKAPCESRSGNETKLST